MLPTDVVGVIAVGVARSAVRSAKARVPFLARLTGQGVESGDTSPPIVRVNTAVPVPHAFVAERLIVKKPGLLGTPEKFPVFVLKVIPWGSGLAVKLVGL